MPAMTPDDLAKAVELLAQEAIAFANNQSADRIKAIEYYDGTMNDTPSDKGRSSVVSRDFRAATKKVLPAIVRTILGSDKVVEYQPVGPNDEEAAAQATDFINLVVMLESRGEEMIRDAVHDALRLRNGVIKWWWDTKTSVQTSQHSGLTIEELAALSGEDDEILEQSVDEYGLYSVKVRRREKQGRARFACIPLEEFYISPDAMEIEDALFVAHNQKLKRFELVAMGYDRNKVASLKAWAGQSDQEAERSTRREYDETADKKSGRGADFDEIDYWECFVRVDADGDGIAELRRVVMAGGWDAESILDDEETDEAPFADLVIERRPHEWMGRSLFDDIYDIQRIKTVLLRNTLDNIYWQNNLQPIVQDGALTPNGLDAVHNPGFGKPIMLEPGRNVNDAITFNQVPFVAKQAFEMLGYMDDALTDRTGISDQSGGLPPDALQNVTAKASALMEQQAISQVELMVRNVATGLKRLFRGLLKTISQHQDKTRTVRLRDKWADVDPRSWNVEMDAVVNVGLGAGTRERDMMAMQMVVNMQTAAMTQLGPDNPLVKPDQMYNGLQKLAQAAGVKNTDAFFTKPDPAEVQQKLAEAKNTPSPEQQKMQAQMQIEQAKAQATLQLEQAKLQIQMQLEQAKMQADASKEREQRDADLYVRQKELENKQAETAFTSETTRQLELAKIEAQGRIQLERELIILQRTQEFEREKMAHTERMAAAKMANDNAIAEQKSQSNEAP